MGYGALKPGVSSNTSKIAQAVSNIPDAIDGNVPLLKKIQNVAQSDIPAQAAQPSALARTFDSTIKRGKRDLARTRRFFTGKGAGIETTQIPLGKSFTTTDPVTGAVSRQFVPDVDRTGNVVTRAVENLNPNAQLDDVAAVDRIAGSIAGGSAGAVAGLGGGIAGAAGGAGIGGVLGGLAGTSLLPGLGTAGGAVLGAKAGAAMGGMAGAVTPAIIGGVTGAQKGVRGTYDAFKDRGARDIGKLKELADSSGLSNRAAQARTWMGFEYESQAYPYRKISTFAAPSYYKTGALLGGGLGTGLGVVNGVSSTINRQQDREEQELNDIAAIDNPYIRQGTYQEYTSPEQRSLRALRNGADITGRGALGALTGGGLGVGLGGLAGASIDQNTPAKKSILERIYGR
jgi:hypothetical protein